jgi:multiple sugar transport system permease protein
MRVSPRRKTLGRVLIYVAVVFLVIQTIAPFAWMFISSISESQELLRMPPHWIPERPTLKRYVAILLPDLLENDPTATRIMNVGVFARAVWNSVLVAGSTTAICLFLGLLASYALSRLRFGGKRVILLTIICLQMLPAIATIIPLFYLMRLLQLTDKPVALIITYCGFTLTYVVWVMTGYINNLPREMEDAALIDGCSHMQALRHVVLPLALPGMIAVGTFSFLMAWNEFLYALVFTFTEASKTIPVVISEFGDKFGLDYGLYMTGGFIASLPPVILALAFQRYLVSGLAAGAVKG